MKKQEEVIDYFYKNFLTWQMENIGMRFGAGFCVFMAFIMFCVPYQSFLEEDGGIGLVLLGGGCAYFALWLYIRPYFSFREQFNMKNLMDKMRLLPVERDAFTRYSIKKMTRFSGKMFLIYLAGQLLFAGLGYKSVGIFNFLFPFLGGLVLPLGFNVLILYVEQWISGRR